MGYFRIDLQEKAYISIPSDYPFSFEVPSISKKIDEQSQDKSNNWFDIYYPFYKARIYCTYIPIKKDNFKEVSEDSYRFVYRHTVKADAINEKTFSYPGKHIYGILYTISGNAASPIQFVITDSTKHFFRGALYFDCTPNQDSLRPVINYINEDISQIINTFQWK